MNVLLLNLARFGDLLQTQAAITGLARQGHRVGVVCLDNFAEAAALLSGVAHIAPVPGAAFLPEKAMPERNGTGCWQDALAALAQWREALHAAFVPDRVCNLIPALSSQLLAPFAAKGAPCAGFSVDEHGFRENGGPWASFLQGSTLSRGGSPFNIVDVFRKIAGADAGGAARAGDNALHRPDEGALAAARERLQVELPREGAGCRGFVALQLGASENRRRWPLASFAALGDILWREGKFCPVLLGSKSEVHLAERYGQAARHPYISMCGRTGLRELASVLCVTKLLISNDTGTMHLASGLDLPVLAVFLATAQPFDTGPYRVGSCSVEPDLPCHPCRFGVACVHKERCRAAIAPEFLAHIALARLEQDVWQTPESSSGAGGARVWLSVADGQGDIDLRSLSGHGESGRASWLALQRHYLRQFLDRDAREPGFKPVDMAAPAGFPEDMRGALVGSLEQARGFVEVMRQQGNVLLQRPVPVMRERFLSSWGKVRDSLGGQHLLKALEVIWEQETQAPGRELAQVLALAEDFSALLEHMQRPLRT